MKISTSNLNAALLTAITPLQISSIDYPGDDTAANPAGGQTIIINGSGFEAGAAVLLNSVAVGVVTVVNSTTIQFISPALAAGGYTLYVANPSGGTAISVPGLQYSGIPTWSTGAGTLGTLYEVAPISTTLSATSDSAITYSLYSGTLPTGSTLNSSTGFLSGTAPVDTGSTTYTFTIRASDAELQDTDRTFSLTINTDTVTWSSPLEGATISGTQGEALTQALSSSSAGGRSITYTANALPTGLSIVGSNITGTPTDAYSASSLITATAALSNRTATRTLVWNIALGVPSGKLYSWGNNSYGMLGLGDQINKSSPTQVGTLTTWLSIAAGRYATWMLKKDNTVWTWGQNLYGQLGLNDTASRSSPVQVGSLTTWKTISSFYIHWAAIKLDGTLWVNGYNGQGRLGLGDVVNQSSPVQVGALTTWSSVSAGGEHNAATKTDGTLWVWGFNTYGNLGQGDTISRSSPVQVGALTTWAVTETGNGNTFAVKTDGTLWAWGSNNNGQLGLGNTNRPSSPVQVGALTNWSSISASAGSTVATKTNGTMWTWGYNQLGDLGLGDATYRSSPTQVGALTTWLKAASAYSSSKLAIKTDGTLWTWGRGFNGALGLGDTINRSSPVQVGSLTTWIDIAGGLTGHFAIST
jgi:alpha-tubulin suppressor-like RCC1 family protein